MERTLSSIRVIFALDHRHVYAVLKLQPRFLFCTDTGHTSRWVLLSAVFLSYIASWVVIKFFCRGCCWSSEEKRLLLLRTTNDRYCTLLTFVKRVDWMDASADHQPLIMGNKRFIISIIMYLIIMGGLYFINIMSRLRYGDDQGSSLYWTWELRWALSWAVKFKTHLKLNQNVINFAITLIILILLLH